VANRLFTEAEKWKAVRAVRAWDHQYKAAFLIEFADPEWDNSGEVLSNRTRRLLKSGYVPPEGTEKLPLLIEEDPKAALVAYHEHANRLWHLPRSLSDVERERIAAGKKRTPNARPADDPKLLGLERKLTASKDEIRELRKKLRATHRDDSVYERLALVIEANVAPLEPAKVVRRERKKDATPVTGVLQLSDEHADQQVSASGSWGLEVYGWTPFRCRLWKWATTVVDFVNSHLPNHDFENLIVAKLGDGVNGEIHDMEYRNHFGNSLKAALAVGDAEAQAIQYIYRETGVPITVVGVPGNHGRKTRRKDYENPHDSYDFLIMTQIANRLALEPEIEVYSPETFTVFLDVRGHVFSLNHGDDVRGTWGIPWYGFTRRSARVQAATASAGQSVDVFLYGHFHEPALTPATGGQSWHNGAFPVASAFSAEALQGFGVPIQWFHVVDDHHGVQLPIPIHLRDVERERIALSGEWEPPFGSRTIVHDLDPPIQDGGLHIIQPRLRG